MEIFLAVLLIFGGLTVIMTMFTYVLESRRKFSRGLCGIEFWLAGALQAFLIMLVVAAVAAVAAGLYMLVT